MDGLLRKKDLVDAVGVAKSTIADWVTEFHVYIPTVKHGAVTYYKPEALDVLNVIRELREKEHSKVQIMELLAKKGFPITVEEAVEDVERVLAGADPRDTLLTVMQTMGQAVIKQAEQDGRINRIDTRIDGHSERLDGQDGRIQTVVEKQDEQGGRMTDLEQTVAELLRREEETKRQLAEAQAEAAAAKAEAAEAKEQANKRRGLFGKLFG